MRAAFTLTLVTMRPDLKGQRKQVWYYRLSTDPARKKRSTGIIGRRNRWQAEAYVRGLLEEHRAVSPDRITLRRYADPFFIEGRCPHIARLRQEQKSIGVAHINKSRKLLEQHVLADPIAEKPIADIKRGDLFDFRGRLLEKLQGKRNTIDKIMSTVNTVLGEAFNRDDIPSNPMYRVGLVHHRSRRVGQQRAARIVGPEQPFPGERHRPPYRADQIPDRLGQADY